MSYQFAPRTLCVLLLFLVAHSALGQGGTFDAERLEQLLGSKKIRELRLVTKIVKRYPGESLPILSRIGRRANHPELTAAFEFLITYADEQQLRQLLGADTIQQKGLVRAELENRRLGRTTQRKRVAPVIAAQTPRQPPPTPNDRRPATSTVAKPDTATSPKPAVASNERSTVRSGPAMPSVNSNATSQPRAAGKTLSEADEALLRELLQRGASSEAEWEFLLTKLDQDGISDSIVTRLTRAITRRLGLSDYRRLQQRFLDQSLKHPERLLAPVGITSPKTPEVSARFLEFALSPDPKIRSNAISYFPRIREGGKEIAEKVIAWSAGDPEKESEIPRLLVRIVGTSDAETKKRVLDWLLDHVDDPNTTPARGIPEYRSLSRVVSASRDLLRWVETDVHEELAREIGTRLGRAKRPFQYLHLLRLLKGDLSPASDAVRKFMATRQDQLERFFVANVLYRTTGDAGEVFPMFRNAIDAIDDQVMREGLFGLGALGADAAPVVPRLIEILKESSDRTNRIAVATTLGNIGPDAAPAVPLLVQLFEQTLDAERRSSTQIKSLLEAFTGIGPKAADAIPAICTRVETTLNETPAQSTFFCQEAFKTMVAVAPQDKRVQAILEHASQSSNRSVAGMAKYHLNQITSSE